MQPKKLRLYETGHQSDGGAGVSDMRLLNVTSFDG